LTRVSRTRTYPQTRVCENSNLVLEIAAYI
jgi:hypothetical protein